MADQTAPIVNNDAASASSSSSSSRLLWAVTPDVERPVEVEATGFNARTPTTVMETMKRNDRNDIALSVKRDGVWKDWTYGAYHDDCIRFAKSLLHLKLQPNQAVSIIGFNSPEWFIADVGTIAAGGLAAGIYTTNGPDACAYVLDHSKSTVVIAENEVHVRKILQVKDRLPALHTIVQWSGAVPSHPGLTYSWEQFLELGAGVPDSAVEERIQQSKPSNVCTLIYTSGTTGPPKAVMLTHDNLTHTATACVAAVRLVRGNSIISYLPLSHVAAQLVDIHGAMCMGGRVYFAQPDALKGSLSTTLKEVRPSVFIGVPRVWEKIQERMVELGKANGSVVQKTIASWARSVGLRGSYAKQKSEDVPWGWTVSRLLVFDKVKEALGFDQARIVVSAAAPLAIDTTEFFLSFDLPICDVYGMSELAGPSTINVPEQIRTGSVGKPVAGMRVKIDHPDPEGNGELCFKGRSVFLGYMHNEKETREAFDADGWVHTGDIGRMDADGFIYITGRIKELIITAGGENVAPVLIEDELKLHIGSVVSNAMVVGDKKKFLAVLLTLKTQPNRDAADGQYPYTDLLTADVVRLLETLGSNAKTVQEAQQDPALKKWINDGMTRYNKRAISNAQQLRAFTFLPVDFTQETDTLTPTMKLKRRIVLQKFSKEMEDMYVQAEKDFAGSS